MIQQGEQSNIVAVLTSQIQRLKGMTEQMRREKDEAQRNFRKLEAQFKTLQFKLNAIESEKQRIVGDNRRFMQNFESQKKQKIKFLTEASEAKNLVTRRDTQIASLKVHNDNLANQNNRLTSELENSNSQYIGALKDRQNTVNSVKLLETKLEAAETEKQYLLSKVSQLEAECIRTKEELSVVTKKYNDKQIGVEAIYRDEESTKQKLLGQFQRKISIKDEQMKQELQKYMNQNAMLKQQVIQLQAGKRQ